MFCIPFTFYYCQQFLFTLRVPSLASPLNDVSVDIADDERSFQFSPEAGFTSPLYLYTKDSLCTFSFTEKTSTKLPFLHLQASLW